jgi:hypothetical protein
MFLEQIHQVVFQVAVSAGAYMLAMQETRRCHFDILGKTSFLRKLNQLAFALARKPRMRHNCG